MSDAYAADQEDSLVTPTSDTTVLLDLVGLVYATISEQQPWSSLATGLQQHLGAKAVSITLYHSPELSHDIQVMACEPGDQVDWLAVERSYREHFAHIDALHPKQVKPGQVVVLDTPMIDPECADYFARLGIYGSLRTCFNDPTSQMRCWVDIVRGSTQAANTTSDAYARELLEVLAPHLSRALGLYAKLQQHKMHQDIYAMGLDHLALGCLMLDGQAHILCANQAANDILRPDVGLSIAGPRLLAQDTQVQHELNQAIDNAMQLRATPQHSDEMLLLRVPLIDGMLLGLLVTPAPWLPHYQGQHVPQVIIYVVSLGDTRNSQAAAQSTHASAAVARLFGLTPQEGKLALLLAAGSSMNEAAEQLGVAISAARNYSKSIYAKLNIRGQNDLIRLISKSFALLR